MIDFELRGEHIALDALLKATGVASSGGEARSFITAGRVSVDGQVESRKTRKVRTGQVVSLHGVRIRVHAPAADPPEATGGPPRD